MRPSWPVMCVALVLLVGLGRADDLVSLEFHRVPAAPASGVVPPGVAGVAPTEGAVSGGAVPGGAASEPSAGISNWAGMLVEPTGAVVVTAGNHGRATGNSWAWRFDPATKDFKLLVDIDRDAGEGEREGRLGHGKFHAPPLLARDGRVYLLSAYYNQPMEDVKGYAGALLFSYGPADGAVRHHGVAFPDGGVFGAVYLPSRHALAAIVLPQGRAQVLDLESRRVTYTSAQAAGLDARMVARDLDDRIYYHDAQGALWRHDPRTQASEQLKIRLPSARDLPPRNGRAYEALDDHVRVLKPIDRDHLVGVTRYGLFFVIDLVGGTARALGSSLDREPAIGPNYVADFAVSAGRGRVYFVGGTQNQINGYAHDNPLIELDLASGAKRVLARVNAQMKQQGLPRFRWSYAASLSADEKTLYLCVDAAGDEVYLVVGETPLN